MHRQRREALQEVASEQRGFFTARQAVLAGFDARNHPYHVRAGNWVRERRGIYRLKNYPLEPESDYVMWSLWSCNKAGIVQGVFSFETALSIYELSDVSPVKIHMTVPNNFNRKVATPEVLVLYKDNITPEEWRDMDGFRVTTPTRTLSDIIFSQRISRDFVCQAIEEGMARGLYPVKELKNYGIHNITQELLVKYAR